MLCELMVVISKTLDILVDTLLQLLLAALTTESCMRIKKLLITNGIYLVVGLEFTSIPTSQ